MAIARASPETQIFSNNVLKKSSSKLNWKCQILYGLLILTPAKAFLRFSILGLHHIKQVSGAIIKNYGDSAWIMDVIGFWVKLEAYWTLKHQLTQNNPEISPALELWPRFMGLKVHILSFNYACTRKKEEENKMTILNNKTSVLYVTYTLLSQNVCYKAFVCCNRLYTRLLTFKWSDCQRFRLTIQNAMRQSSTIYSSSDQREACDKKKIPREWRCNTSIVWTRPMGFSFNIRLPPYAEIYAKYRNLLPRSLWLLSPSSRKLRNMRSSFHYMREWGSTHSNCQTSWTDAARDGVEAIRTHLFFEGLPSDGWTG